MRFVYALCLVFLLAACAAKPVAPRNGLYQGSRENSSCAPLSIDDRLRILSLADPSNYKKTRYHRGPRYGARNIETETDCSSFVHEIYNRAGLEFVYRSTRDIRRADEFEEIEESQAKPGDLMVFSGHVGIIAEDGKIISATKVHRRKKQKSAITKMAKENFSRRRYVLRYRCGPNSMAGR